MPNRICDSFGTVKAVCSALAVSVSAGASVLVQIGGIFARFLVWRGGAK